MKKKINQIKNMVLRLFKPSIDEDAKICVALYGKGNAVSNAIKQSMIEHPLVKDVIFRAVCDFLDEKEAEAQLKSDLEDLGITTKD